MGELQKTAVKKDKVQTLIQDALSKGGASKGGATMGNAKGMGKTPAESAVTQEEEFKVKVVGFQTDTKKVVAEEALNGRCAKMDGFLEAFMPGGKNKSLSSRLMRSYRANDS